MDVLFQNIEFTIKEAISEYSKIISSKYNIDQDELHTLWQSVSSNIELINKKTSTSSHIEKTKDDDTASIVSTKSSKKSPAKAKVEKSCEGGVCCYIIKRGEKSGSRCDKPKKVGDYCTLHKKYASESSDNASVTGSVVSTKSKASTTSSKPVKKSVDKILRKNKDLDKFWHAESRMVFKSKTERVVIGRESSGEILPLSPDDKMVCEQYGFKYAKEDDHEGRHELAECEDDGGCDESKSCDIEDVLNEIKE